MTAKAQLKRVPENNLSAFTVRGMAFSTMLLIKQIEDDKLVDEMSVFFPWLADNSSVELVYNKFGANITTRVLENALSLNAKECKELITQLVTNKAPLLAAEMKSLVIEYLVEAQSLLMNLDSNEEELTD
jgi:hypothetical protein